MASSAWPSTCLKLSNRLQLRPTGILMRCKRTITRNVWERGLICTEDVLISISLSWFRNDELIICDLLIVYYSSEIKGINPLTPELNCSAYAACRDILLGILISKGLTARRLYNLFGARGLSWTRHWRDWEMCTKQNHAQSPGAIHSSQGRDPIRVVT
jgi:hypothetical protein